MRQCRWNGFMDWIDGHIDATDLICIARRLGKLEYHLTLNFSSS
jgi:hypothetical protein